MFALYWTALPFMLRRDYSRISALAQQLCALADEKDAPFWRVHGTLLQGSLLAMTGETSNTVDTILEGIAALRSMDFILGLSWWLTHLAIAHANLGQRDDAWRCAADAIDTIERTKERWSEAEANRIAGLIALMSPERDATKAEAYFERALGAAREQQAKSWELRAAMSMARLWRDQGKSQQARDLVAPVYGWFIEGFETLDLKEAKALLDELV
jgi:predicted ATPase